MKIDVNIQLNLKSTIRYFIIKNRFNNSGIDVLGQVEFTSNTQHCAKPAAAFSLVVSRGSNVSDAMWTQQRLLRHSGRDQSD